MVDEPHMRLLKDDSLATRFHNNEGESVIYMLRQIIRYVPEKRPSAKELHSHPWFADNGARGNG